MRKSLTIVVAAAFVMSFAGCGDDGNAGGNNNTVNCTDADGDGFGVGTDCNGPDCNDGDPACVTVGAPCCLATNCTDVDGDGYGEGTDCLGTDCNDADNACHEGTCCQSNCADADGDGFGNGTDCQGADCDDSDNTCWMGACCPGDCTDNDTDGYGVGSGCAGPDCNDNDANCFAGACCPAGSGDVGEACGDVSQCTGITNGTAECLLSIGGVINFPNGYCTGSGCIVGQACDGTGNSICVDLMGYLQYCLVECTAPSDCRESDGYDCSQIPQAPATDPMYCLPGQGGP